MKNVDEESRTENKMINMRKIILKFTKKIQKHRRNENQTMKGNHFF